MEDEKGSLAGGLPSRLDGDEAEKARWENPISSCFRGIRVCGRMSLRVRVCVHELAHVY